jgi:hypothetical protein
MGTRKENRMKRWAMAPVLALLVLPAAGCEDLLFDDPEHTYDGPPTVEFAPVLPAGTYARTISFTPTATENQTTAVRVNFIAAAPASVSGEVVRSASSTAVEGTHYRFTSGSAYSMAAGTWAADVPIEVLASGFAPGESVTLVLELAPGSGFEVSENYKQFTLTLERSS